MASSAGRQVTDFVQTMRADLFQLVVHNGDVRRATVHALGPILRGAVTVDQLFQRRLSRDDIDRLDLMFDTWLRQGPDRLAPAVKLLRSYFKLTDGQTIADLFPT